MECVFFNPLSVSLFIEGRVFTQGSMGRSALRCAEVPGVQGYKESF